MGAWRFAAYLDSRLSVEFTQRSMAASKNWLSQVPPRKHLPEKRYREQNSPKVNTKSRKRETAGRSGPQGKRSMIFTNPGQLWRLGKGQYEVEGVRKFESPREVKHADRFLIQLSRDLTPIRMTEFAKLVWQRDPGPLTCKFLVKEVHCSSGARR